MRVGLGLLNAGETSRYSSLAHVAQHAEALGYDSLWVTERDPFPLASHSRAGAFTGELHLSRKPIDSTLDALAIAAINTDRIRLGVSLPNIPFYSPTEVGESLAALDVLSDGRVQVGLGLGWTPADFVRVSLALADRQTPASEFVRAMRAVWDGLSVGFTSEYYSMPAARGVITPVQRPSLPVMLTAFAPAAVQPPAMLLRGGSPLMAAMSSEEMAESLRVVTGRSRELGLVVRAVVRLTDGPIGESRAMFTGSAGQLRDDFALIEALGADEVQFDLSRMPFELDNSRLFDVVAQLREMVTQVADVPAAVAA
ncbi:MAG TPA: LLM class flavin-dependent oxidoreductase [Thermomicrobiales bacterium]|nr:LLM class flavin-dependent oxidoreductase [Thermomicrobiales bacterium]